MWYYCMSLRGAVYFGTSVHIFVGLLLLLRWILMLCIEEKLMTELVLTLTIFYGIYLVILITLGCLIFAGMERVAKTITMLKWSSICFTILQVLILSVLLILYLCVPDGLTHFLFLSPESDEPEAVTIGTYLCFLVATVNYIPVLLLYTYTLWSLKRPSVISGGSNKERASTPLTNIQISHPIQRNQTEVAVVPSPSEEGSSILKRHGPARPRTSVLSSPLTSPWGVSSINLKPGFSMQSTPSTSSSCGNRRFYPENSSASQSDKPGRTVQVASPSSSTPSSAGGNRFYPANYLNWDNGSRMSQVPEIHNVSNRSSAGSGMHYYQRSFPHPRRAPIIPFTISTASIANSSSAHNEEYVLQTQGPDWMRAYATDSTSFRGDNGDHSSIANINNADRESLV